MSGLLTILAAGEPSPASAPSNYMPSVRVEIAWNAGQRTPASLYTWTDVTDYVELAEGITITGGRQDERSTADANQLTLTFDNRDGRFTAGRTSGPYGSGVKLNRPIRVISDPVDGWESVRFLGYVNEWPLDWSDATDATAYATITASSRLSRLGLQANLHSIIEQEILADSPVAYYTMGEPSGATQANDSSGTLAPPMTMQGSGTDVVFGNATGPGTDSLTAAEFAGTFGDKYLKAAASVPPSANQPASVEAFFASSTPPTSNPSRIVASGNMALVLTSSTGQASGSVGGSSVAGAVNLCDGAVHHIAGTWDSTTFRLYVDGAEVGTVASGSSLVGEVIAGESTALPLPDVGFVGSISHVASYTSTLSAARIAAHAAAGATGFAGETTDARLIRYAALAGIPAAEVNAEAGQTTMAHVDTTDKQPAELMRTVETTEGGVLYDERDGTLTMQNRTHRYAVGSAYTLNMAEQEVEAGYAPKYDRTGLLNDVTAKNVASTVTARKVDDASIYDYGLSVGEVTTASENDTEPNNLASWLVNTYKDPKERAPALIVDALAQVGKTPNCATVMATTVGTKITVSNRPSQAATSSVDYFVEGWTETYGPESLTFTFNVSPSAPYDQVLIVDDPTRGVVDTNMVAF